MTKGTTKTATAEMRAARFPGRAAALLALAMAAPWTAWGTGVAAGDDALAQARAVVSGALARYEAAASYSLDFVQETYWALADSTVTVRGSLHYRRPGTIAIAYDDGSRIVVAGDSMRVYTAQTNQFFVVGVDSSDVAADPPSLLRACEPDPKRPFAESDPQPGGVRVVNLKPAGPYAEPSRVEVAIDASGNVVSITALSASADRTVYRVLTSRFDAQAPEGAFTLRRPRGATLVKDSPF
jgi:outer membrane lipoprotein-sorting protein